MDSSNLSKPINRLLAALPNEDYQRLSPYLEPVELSPYQILHSVGEYHEYAYFPNNSIVFSMAIMKNGSTTEIGIIGNEGMVGLPIILDSSYTNSTAIVQIPGNGYRIAASRLQEEFKYEGALKTILMRYVQTRMIQLGQTAACNHYHNLEQRFARWLLTIRDNIQKDEFQLAHESISQIMGENYTGTMPVVQQIQRQGIINYHQEKIKILDCKALEELACECYRVLKTWSTV